MKIGKCSEDKHIHDIKETFSPENSITRELSGENTK